MAKCDLSIELDDADRIYPGGGKISGVVRVSTDAMVNCKGLEVSSLWKTHGRGNVTSGTAATDTLFVGEWSAGDQKEYRFELAVADWPPSYQGHYLNIDHYIDARAKIAWSFDPKASVPFLMRPTCSGEDALEATDTKNIGGVLGCVIISIVVCLFLGVGGMIMVVSWPIGFFVVLALMSISLVYSFFRVFLPKYALGKIEHSWKQKTLSPGQPLSGELVISPRRNVPINAITLVLQSREQCVSGSGSNRSTHKNVLFEQTTTLQEATTLPAGSQQRFPLELLIPQDAPYSIDLHDNDLLWRVTLRVDIPRWPDWKNETELTIVPSGSEGNDSVPLSSAKKPAEKPREVTVSGGGGEITFTETARHLWEVREDREQVEMLVEAVSGLTFSIEAIVERRLLYGGDEDPHLYPNGYSVWAHHSDPALPMVLYVPHELADEFENIGRDLWQGRGTIVGWDSRHGRLQVKLEQPS